MANFRLVNKISWQTIKGLGWRHLTINYVAIFSYAAIISICVSWNLFIVVSWLKCTICFQKICEKPQVVQDYEAGRGIPNNLILGKIEKVIGLKLRGKDRGQTLAPPGKKWDAGGHTHYKSLISSKSYSFGRLNNEVFFLDSFEKNYQFLLNGKCWIF